MGCFGSRMDSRRKALDDDWRGTDYAFAVGSIKTLDGFSPLDKVAISLCGEGKEYSEGIGEITDGKMAEDKAKELGKKIFDAMVKIYDDLVSDYKDGTKEGEVHGKYTGTDAIAQMDKALKIFADKSGVEGLVWPKAAEATDAMMEAGMMDEAGMMEEGAMMDGGDGEMAAMEGDAAMAAAPAKKMSLIAEDAFGEVAGPAELPKLLLSLMFCYPVFGDAVKAHTMHHELGGDDKNDLTLVATIVGAFVKLAEKADTPSFGVGCLNADDLEELKAVAADKDNQALCFPGVVGGWASEEDAVGQAESGDGKTQVLFKFQGEVMKPAGDKLHVFARQFAKVDSLEEKPAEGKNYIVCTLSNWDEHAKKTVAEYLAAVEEAKKALEAVKDKVEDAAMMDGEKPMEEGDMNMMEGAGME